MKVAYGAATGKPTTISFDRETAGAVRLDLTSPAPGTDAGFFQLAELQVMGSPVTADATGAAWNGRVLVTPPVALPGMATIQVTSEDGATTRTYLVHVNPG